MGNFNLPPGCTDADIDRAFGPDEECYHDAYEIDILDGRATCDYCGEVWWPSADEERRFREAEVHYHAHCRREERIAWWREFRQRWFWRPTFPIRWAVDVILHKLWPAKWGRRKITTVSISNDDEIPF